jgi:hypothetical protein
VWFSAVSIAFLTRLVLCNMAAVITRKHLQIGEDGFNLSIRGIQYAQLTTNERSITGRVGCTKKSFDWFAYIAPEIDTDFAHDSRVDLWSLGALLYTLLCGVGPFVGTGKEIRERKNKGVVRFEIVEPSANAMSLTRSLIQVDPARRISVDQILRHPWMKEPDSDLSSRELDLAQAMFGDWGRKTR